jgi:hypothetical protein
MAGILKAKIKQEREFITIRIPRKDFEAFCNVAGLFREEFFDLLDASERDHREGRVTKRESLYELIPRKQV